MGSKLIGKVFLAGGAVWLVISLIGIAIALIALPRPLTPDELVAVATAGAAIITLPTFALLGFGAVLLKPDWWITFH